MSKDHELTVQNRRLKAVALVSDFYKEEAKAGTMAAVQKLCDGLKANALWDDADDPAFFDSVAIGFISSAEVLSHLRNDEPINASELHA
jgi:hypothetical protein